MPPKQPTSFLDYHRVQMTNGLQTWLNTCHCGSTYWFDRGDGTETCPNGHVQLIIQTYSNGTKRI